MSRILERFTSGVAVAGIAAMFVSGAAYIVGARINTTKSIPIGLYWISNEPVAKGAYVMFCPPQNGVFVKAKERGYIGAGFCPGGFGYMIKRILAAKNDIVAINDEGVRVNGELLPLSVPRKVDTVGQALPQFHVDHYRLGEAELLLMSDVSDTSFDGRYFGPVNRSQIKAVIRPVITQ
ncbi:conjugative transfer signal peptidase TraF [Methylobacter luteus]|uniref:conjugative transfer signal peptidase TraF n=1 Tax=Methylobacter luteus TaxID=415 RepID=UPI0004006B84|nr:conjugative transfer signal peptidase TraF [Methylobacter luteus]